MPTTYTSFELIDFGKDYCRNIYSGDLLILTNTIFIVSIDILQKVMISFVSLKV